MNYQEAENKIIELIRKMERNHFLLPDSFSEKVQMVKRDWSYKSYVGTRGDTGRYMQFEITLEDGGYNVEIRRNSIGISVENIKFNYPTPDELYGFIRDIYEEKHSFVENAEGIKKLRHEKSKMLEEKKSIEKQIKQKDLEIKGALEVQNK